MTPVDIQFNKDIIFYFTKLYLSLVKLALIVSPIWNILEGKIIAGLPSARKEGLFHYHNIVDTM
jgi:hypothetical protein